MPYRIDISHPRPETLDILVRLGALDVELVQNGLAAIMPDDVNQNTLAGELGSGGALKVSAAVARDEGSVWMLSGRSVRIGNLVIASPETAPSPGTLRLHDSVAFGTGHHSTTALCLEALEELLALERVGNVLDVGTGSGILALAALTMGVPEAVGLDTNGNALEIASRNARLNHLDHRLQLRLGGPDVVDGVWPLVVANVLTAPLIDMAPVLARRLGSRGRLILSGIHSSLERDVRQAYQHFGMRQIGSETRAGWTAASFRSSW